MGQRLPLAVAAILAVVGPGTVSAAQSTYLVWAEPAATYTPVYRFILSAHRSLDMVMYELGDETAEHDLAADAARGVDVRVLLDRAYHGGSYNEPAAAYLKAAGVQVKWAPSPVIVHEKAIVVDGRAALIMTGNLTSKYYSTSADFTVEDAKAPDVATVVRAFDEDWAGDLTKSWYEVPVRGQEGDLVFSPGSEGALVGLLRSAKHSVETSSEEMDNYSVEGALEADARRGVDVKVLMTEDDYWDKAFAQLKAAGVHVRLYPYAARALYIHAKAIVVDNKTAYVGSINYSTASLVYNRELGLVTSNPTVVRTVGQVWGRWWAGAPIKYS